MPALFLLLTALSALALVACSNGGADQPAPLATVAETPTSSPEPAESPTVEPTETPQEVITTGDVEEEDGPKIDVLVDYLQAVGLLNASMYKEAIGRFSVVLRIHPDLYLAYHGRALAYYNEDLFDLAMEDFDRAIELKPDFAEALRNRGVILGNERNYAQAREDLTRAANIYRTKGDLEAMDETLSQLQRLPR